MYCLRLWVRKLQNNMEQLSMVPDGQKKKRNKRAIISAPISAFVISTVSAVCSMSGTIDSQGR